MTTRSPSHILPPFSGRWRTILATIAKKNVHTTQVVFTKAPYLGYMDIYIYVNILYILYRYIFLHIMVLSWYTWLYLSAFWSSIFMPQYHGAFFFQAPGFNHLSAPPSPPKRQSGCPFSIPLPYATSSRAGLPGFPNAQLRGNAIAGWSFIQKSSHEHWEF